MKTLVHCIILFCFTGIINLVNAQITYKSAFPNISFNFPVEITNPGDGSDRLFVVEQPGKIKVFNRNENVTSSDVSTFLDISSRISFRFGIELGLLGLAFHPNYKDNGYFYIYYTTTANGRNPRMIVSRFSASQSNPNIADPNSEFVIFQFDKNQNNSNHNGGKIAFGPDGYLYISVGDGGGGNDPQRNAQNINNVFGSICRIDVDVDGNNAVETNPEFPNGRYEIPADNPFVGRNGLDEIFAYGIRNTWKFSFDAPTGRLWGADVGQNAFEEINLIKNGKNYGWNRFEAQDVANNIPVSGPTENPILFYNHRNGDFSVTGGYVYRGSKIKSTLPDINSKYIFADYISGRVWSMDFDSSNNTGIKTELFKTNGEAISSFGLDNSGELYFSSYGNEAKIFQIIDGVAPAVGNNVEGEGNWNNLDNGISNGEVNAIAVAPNGDVYHGGSFNQAGSISVNNLAVFNETTGWSAVGAGTNGTVNAIEIDSNGLVYIGGAFTKVDNISANGIAVWNGTEWQAVGIGNEIDGIVQALAIDNTNQVYAGGVFENLSGALAQNIAKWNGSAWSILTDNTTNEAGTNNEIRVLSIDPVNNNLYLGGNFDIAGGITANRIAIWNDATEKWSNLGEGTSGFVEAIVATENEIFAGGNFAIAGGKTVNRLASWNKANQTWDTVGNGVDSIVKSLVYNNENLFIGGSFTLASFNDQNFIVNGIARWNETNGWSALGDTEVGIDNKVNSIVINTNQTNSIYTVGNFTRSGRINANNTSVWSSDDSSTLSVTDVLISSEKVYSYINPINDKVVLKDSAKWQIYDLNGVYLDKGIGQTINLESYSPGLYFITLNNETTIKIVKQ
ncbi:PQQ-dependent sugar dehydrogenase [Aquimarina agarivorans]|uniref:PQQ-dependent sugar dehydrogenase n=1 Tax=Aquimarina agarivorans TaxID=980584 RepID=UPI000248FD39|nr:PQQ-dependent sugar dehydrogenase [Aquimarina agarivorans]